MATTPADDMAGAAVTTVAVMRDVGGLAGLEARLVARTLVVIVALTVVLALALAGVWISLAFALGVLVAETAALGSVAGALAVAGAHLLLACTVGFGIRRLRRRLSFPETRAALCSLLATEEPDHRKETAD